MDDFFFIKNINWDKCTNPINAIDFSAHLDELEKLEATLEMLGLSLREPIAPVPIQYIDTVIPALILARLNDPVSVIHTYNEFFINKKEEITPLLNQ